MEWFFVFWIWLNYKWNPIEGKSDKSFSSYEECMKEGKEFSEKIKIPSGGVTISCGMKKHYKMK